MPVKVALLKLTQTNTIKQLYDKHHFIDDFILPISSLKSSIEKFHDSLNVTITDYNYYIHYYYLL